MTASFTNDVDYENYARHCLTLASRTPHRESRLILREMAAEWLKLALPGAYDGEAADHASPSLGAALDD